MRNSSFFSRKSLGGEKLICFLHVPSICGLSLELVLTIEMANRFFQRLSKILSSMQLKKPAVSSALKSTS